MTQLLILYAVFSIIICPLMLLSGIDNMFGILGGKAWWWNGKQANGENRIIDIIFIIIPIFVGMHWLIVAIWAPNLYK